MATEQEQLARRLMKAEPFMPIPIDRLRNGNPTR
jgi:hypothetical protein